MIGQVRKNARYMICTALVTAGALLLLQSSGAWAQGAPAAESVGPTRIETITKTRPLPPVTGARLVNFMDFDLNGDGVLSTEEAGEMLFKLFDGDGNGVIDNVEFETRNVMTVVPMEKETIVKYDFDDAGNAQKVERTQENFIEKTQLSRFDQAGQGLSPHEFVGKTFRQMDVNRSGFIEKNEWQGAYNETINRKNHNQSFYNR